MPKVMILNKLSTHAEYGKMFPGKTLDVSAKFAKEHAAHLEVLEEDKPKKEAKKKLKKDE